MPDGERSTVGPANHNRAQVCPLCQREVSSSQIEQHLRHTHALLLYRGVHRSFGDTLEAIQDDLIGHHVAEAWPMLQSLAQEKGQQGGSFIVEQLLGAFRRVPPGHQERVIVSLAEILPCDDRLLAILLTPNHPLLNWLALRLFALHFSRLDRNGSRRFRLLLLDSTQAEEVRLDALALALQHMTDPGPMELFLRKLNSALGKGKASEWCRRLEQRLGNHPLLARLQSKLEDKVKLSCPRCEIELPRTAMQEHLWNDHRLLLEGLKVRDPWNLIESWLDLAKQERDPQFLQRARIAVEKIDPLNGSGMLTRLLLVRDLADRATRQAYLHEARQAHAGCCPICFARVPIPKEEPACNFQVRGHRLVSEGYQIIIDEHGLKPSLQIYTPAGLFLDINEPGNSWTPCGAAFLFALGILLLALLCAVFWPFDAPWRPVIFLFFIAVLVHTSVKMLWRSSEPTRDRLIDHAWHELIPRLTTDSLVPAETALVAGLARFCSRVANTDAPSDRVEKWIQRMMVGLDRGEIPAGHLAALVRLRIEQYAAEEEDPVPIVVRWLGRCFEGKLPLTFAQHLLEDWATAWWTTINLARLRILLCDRAFEAGFEVRGLVAAGENAPALGTVLGINKPRSLAALRLIWSMRPTRPWERLGELKTAFQIAADPEHAEALGVHPELLLRQQHSGILVAAGGIPEEGTPATIVLTLSGVWLQEVQFIIPPRIVEVRRRVSGSEMFLGPEKFRSPTDLEQLSRIMERWFRWVFHEFQPQVDRVEEWRSPDRAAILRAWGAVNCPECGCALLPRVGEVGIAVEKIAGAESGK